MKKIAIIFALVFVLSNSAFADGDMNTGGRTCQPTEQQSCPTIPPQPLNGAAASTGDPENSDAPDEAEEQSDGNAWNGLFDYLDSLFR